MSTVALTAFHAQRFDIVDQVAALAGRYATTPKVSGTADLSAKMARLWCTQIDSYILRGGLPNRDSGLSGVLEFIQEIRDRHFPFAHLGPDEILARGPSILEAKAIMRLLAREAEVSGLIFSSRAAADALFAKLERLEAALSNEKDQHDPLVLSGRVARRYIRYLLQHPALLNPTHPTSIERSAVIAKILALLGVNASRLRRFSGADRVGVMLDHARLDLARQDYLGALSYAQEANQRAFSGSVSYGGKLDVLAVLAEVNLRYVEHGLLASSRAMHRYGGHLDIAGRAAHDLQVLAEHLDAQPARALASVLSARTLLATMRLKRARGSYRGPHVADPLAKAREELSMANELLSSIGDVSLDHQMKGLLFEIEQLSASTGASEVL